MTDTAAILARHVPESPPNYKPYEVDVCLSDRQGWPCDAHQLGVALENEEKRSDRWVIEADQRLQAAEAREARLRAALESARTALQEVRSAAGYGLENTQYAALAHVGSEGTDA